MFISATTLFVALIVALSILSMFVLWREWDRREKTRLADQKKIADLERRVIDLEAANKLRVPQKAALEILNAIAEYDLVIDEKKIEVQRYENIKGHLINAMTVGTLREKK